MSSLVMGGLWPDVLEDRDAAVRCSAWDIAEVFVAEASMKTEKMTTEK